MGVELPEEGQDGNMMFSDGNRYKMLKTANGNEYLTKLSKTGKIIRKESKENKEAETRKQRLYEREQKKLNKNKKKNVEKLEVPLEKRKKPPRDDLRKPKLFENEHPLIGLAENSEELIEKAQMMEKQNSVWADKMADLGFNQNARRAAFVLEERLLAVNESPKERIKVIRQFLPQILASKIVSGKTLQQKVDKAKEKFSDKILDLSFTIDSKISTSKNKSEDLRSILEKVL